MNYDALIQQYAKQYNIDPQLMHAVIKTESAYNPKAVSNQGARGLGQQIDSTAKALGIDPTDPEQSIKGVAMLLDENLNRYGNPEQAILAYHGGTDQANWGPKTQDYLRKVSSNYGAPAMAKPQTSDAFEASFGARPGAQPVAQAQAEDPFEASFGVRPSTTAEPAQVAANAGPVGEPISIMAAQTDVAPSQGQGLAGQAWQALQSLGNQGISNANAVGRGISDALDAPAEWLAKGAEKSGLTGLLSQAGISMPTYDQQVAIDKAGRAAYDQANPDGGLQGMISRGIGNIAGVAVPIAGVESGLVTGGRALSEAVGGLPQAVSSAGNFLRGQGGVASQAAYNGLQGAGIGALLSGGGQDMPMGDQMALGAALGAASPVAGAALRYLGNTGKAVVAPFTEAGRASIAQRSLLGEAKKDPLNMGQAVAPTGGASSANAASAGAEVAALGQSADDVIGRAGAGGRIAASFDELVPGSQPTLAQATGNAGVAALERAAMSRAPNAFTERQMSNYAARNAYMDTIKGTPETLQAAIAKREQDALPYLSQAMESRRPANATPVLDEIDDILKSESGQRDEVVKALRKVRDKIDLGGEKGLQTDALQLYGIRKSINDQLSTVSGRDNSASQLASKELIQVRGKLDDVIEGAAPDFRNFLSTYSELSRPIDAQRYLQGLDLTDQTSNRITLNKVKSALNKIEKQRAAPGANEAKSITDEQLGMLRNLHADLQREANSSRGMAIGSNTFQNFATNQLIDAMLPGKVGGMVGGVAPGAVGGALGYALGGPLAAGIGATGATQAAGMYRNAVMQQGPEIEARLIDYLLNPAGGRVLQDAAKGGKPGPLQDLIRRAAPTSAPAFGAPGGQNN